MTPTVSENYARTSNLSAILFSDIFSAGTVPAIKIGGPAYRASELVKLVRFTLKGSPARPNDFGRSGGSALAAILGLSGELLHSLDR
jgi:hypothetical protein